MYYEIELNNTRLANGMTDSQKMLTTTVLLKNSIIVSIEFPMIPYFVFKEEKMEYFVRFDLISDFGDRKNRKEIKLKEKDYD